MTVLIYYIICLRFNRDNYIILTIPIWLYDTENAVWVNCNIASALFYIY